MPAMLAIGVVWTVARRNYPRLANRIGAGLIAGFIAILIGGEPVRLLGVALGGFPTDMPNTFGKWILGQMETNTTVVLTGAFYHVLLNGSTFGLMYALLFGKTPWAWGILWLLFFELGMMIGPPVLVMFGPFGVHGAWPGLFLASFAVHISAGVVLGLLAQRWIRDKETIIEIARRSRSTPRVR